MWSSTLFQQLNIWILLLVTSFLFCSIWNWCTTRSVNSRCADDSRGSSCVVQTELFVFGLFLCSSFSCCFKKLFFDSLRNANTKCSFYFARFLWFFVVLFSFGKFPPNVYHSLWSMCFLSLISFFCTFFFHTKKRKNVRDFDVRVPYIS